MKFKKTIKWTPHELLRPTKPNKKNRPKFLYLVIKEFLKRIMTTDQGDSSSSGHHHHHHHHHHPGYGGGNNSNGNGAAAAFAYQKTARRAVPILTWLIPIGAIASVINVAIPMCTGEWLKSCERIPVSSTNSSNKDEFHIKTTVSGLWTLCYANTTEELDNMHCFSIDYFAKDRYTPEPHDSTNAIPYTVTKAGPLFIVATILLGFAIFAATVGYLWRKYRIATFIAGIIFIISGLIMLIGLVVYLSVLQSEVGTKLRARNALEKPLFRYSYGYGFILLVVGFMLTELTGTCAIFWYIYWHQLDWARKEGYGNGDILIGSTRPISNGFESESNYSTSMHNNPSSIGWSVNQGNNHHRPPQHNHHHHHNRTGSNNEPDNRGFGRTGGENSYYTYTTAGTTANSVTYCKKHGCTGGIGFQMPPPCTCNNASFKKYQQQHAKHQNSHYYHHYDDDIDILDVPFPPPPPQRPIPRDITCTTTVSSDDFYVSAADQQQQQQHIFQRDSRDMRKTTPV